MKFDINFSHCMLDSCRLSEHILVHLNLCLEVGFKVDTRITDFKSLRRWMRTVGWRIKRVLVMETHKQYRLETI